MSPPVLTEYWNMGVMPSPFFLLYSSSTVNKFELKSEVSKERFCKEKAAFIVRKRGTLAFRGKEDFGS